MKTGYTFCNRTVRRYNSGTSRKSNSRTEEVRVFDMRWQAARDSYLQHEKGVTQRGMAVLWFKRNRSAMADICGKRDCVFAAPGARNGDGPEAV